MYQRKPEWLRVKLERGSSFFKTERILKKLNLNTVCREARCPNRGECWSRGTATFMILGSVCTRACAFCAVEKGKPSPPDPEEPARLAEAVNLMGLKYVVITSVTRDDLPDGGAGHFLATIRAIRGKAPDVKVEILIPDFKGKDENLSLILESPPDVLNHNIETVERLYPYVNRNKSLYNRSLRVLEFYSSRGLLTKSGIMVGLGETTEELKKTFSHLLSAGVKVLTIGQYLQPTKKHLPVSRYYSPEEFQQLKEMALDMGFRAVVSGPLVRSSYMAERLYDEIYSLQ